MASLHVAGTHIEAWHTVLEQSAAVLQAAPLLHGVVAAPHAGFEGPESVDAPSAAAPSAVDVPPDPALPEQLATLAMQAAPARATANLRQTRISIASALPYRTK
jgi:hypothetical protein